MTLAALAVHRSGLPRMQKAAQWWQRLWEMLRHGSNPFRETLPQLVEQTRGVPLGRPKPRYSNLGFQLLGHALATAAGAAYARLVEERVPHQLSSLSARVPSSLKSLMRPSAPGDNFYKI